MERCGGSWCSSAAVRSSSLAFRRVLTVLGYLWVSGHEPRHRDPANTDLTPHTKPQEPLWSPFNKSPAPPVPPLRFIALGRWGRGERREGGDTVRQLFTVVLRSYFTRKQSHGTLDSSSWLVSSPDLKHIPSHRTSTLPCCTLRPSCSAGDGLTDY